MEITLRIGKLWNIAYNEETRKYIVFSDILDERQMFYAKKKAFDFFKEGEKNFKMIKT